MILKLESHLLKVLNAYRCVVEGSTDIPGSNINQTSAGVSKKQTPVNKNEADNQKKQFGYFANNPLYMKLYEVLKAAYVVHKVLYLILT